MDYSANAFHSLASDEEIFLEALSRIPPDQLPQGRILDIGCGAGQLLDMILARHRFAHCCGIDLSPDNVAEAEKRLGTYAETELNIRAGDYLQEKFEPAQLVVSSSTLHLIPAPFEALVAKISDEVASGGYLVFSVPTYCLYNKLLIKFRQLLKICDCTALRRSIARLGHFCYPSLDEAVLRERIPYMFIIPFFLFGKKEDAFLQNSGFTCIAQIKMPFRLGKPIHTCYVYEKK